MYARSNVTQKKRFLLKRDDGNISFETRRWECVTASGDDARFQSQQSTSTTDNKRILRQDGSKMPEKKEKQKKGWRYSGAKELLRRAIIDGTIADDAKPAAVWRKPSLLSFKIRLTFRPVSKGCESRLVEEPLAGLLSI